LVFITHEAIEGDVYAAVEDLKELNKVNGLENIIRIESFK
jgi:hypothetical protein